MPSTTPAPDSIPYMLDGDPLADVADIMASLAARVDRQLGIRGFVDITVTGAATANLPVVFPVGTFTSTPIIVVTSNNSAMLGAMQNPTAAGFDAYVRHINNTTITGPSVYRVYWHAMPSD